MHLNKILYLSIFSSLVFSQTYFDRIFGGDVQFGDSRSMGLANSYTTTGTTSSVTSKNPARLAYLPDGKEGISVDFQFNLRSYYERRSINILDSFGDFLTETDYVSNQHGHFYNSLGLIYGGKSFVNDKVKYGIGLSLMPITSFNYNYKEEIRFQNMDIDTPGDIGIVDAALGFHNYKNEGTIDLASLGFGISIENDNMRPVSIGFAINKLLSTSITDEVIVDTVYNSINPNVYENLSNFESSTQTTHIKSKFYPSISLEVPYFKSNKSSIVLAYEPKTKVSSKNYSGNFYFSNLSGLPWLLDFNEQTSIYNLKLQGAQFFKPKKITIGMRYNELQFSGSLMIFEFVKEFYSEHEIQYLSDNNETEYFKLEDISNFRIAFEHKFKMGNSIRMGLEYKTALLNQLNPLTKFSMGSNKKINQNLNIDFALSYFITNYRYDDIFPVGSSNNQTNCNEFCEKVNESNMSISTTFKWGF